MKPSTALRFKNLSILIIISWVLCLAPLTDIHLENNTEVVGYVHGQTHSEISFSIFLHELLFTHLKHTFDHLTVRLFDRNLKASKIAFSKGAESSFNTQDCDTNPRIFAVQSISKLLIDDKKWTARTFSWESSGLSPPMLFS